MSPPSVTISTLNKRTLTRRNVESVDEAERKRHLTEVTANAAELLAHARRDRVRRARAGEDVAWLDEVVRALEPLGDLATFGAILAVVDRHGAGPYPAEELAAIAGADVDSVRRVLAQMTAEGLAVPAERPPDAPPSDR
ncbi:hypothetical protein AB0B45_44420 [Nonomuraea sp. NPDC049152]|uniref:hypothetical protein n=1 Tax=Nonomuraea sp. NPDC049152 TaxID=3154350 RepID=UPI0034006A99